MKRFTSLVVLFCLSVFMLFSASLPAKPIPVQTYPTTIPKSAIPLLRTSLADSVALTDAATTILKADQASLLTWTLAGNRILDITSNHRAGRVFFLKLTQDATGTRLVSTWDADIVWATGSAPTLTTTATKSDIIEFLDDGVKYVGKVYMQNE